MNFSCAPSSSQGKMTQAFASKVTSKVRALAFKLGDFSWDSKSSLSMHPKARTPGLKTWALLGFLQGTLQARRHARGAGSAPRRTAASLYEPV